MHWCQPFSCNCKLLAIICSRISPNVTSKNHCRHILSTLQDAAHWLMDQDNLEVCEADWHARQEQLQRDAEEAARQEKINRKKLLEKYHLQAVPISAQTHIPTQSRQGTKSKVQITSNACTVTVLCMPRKLSCQAADLICWSHSESGPLQRRCGCHCQRGEVCFGESRTRLGWR